MFNSNLIMLNTYHSLHSWSDGLLNVLSTTLLSRALEPLTLGGLDPMSSPLLHKIDLKMYEEFAILVGQSLVNSAPV